MSISDAANIGTLITATAAAIVSIIIALRQTKTREEVAAVQHSVQTSDGRTIGEMVEKSEKRDIANDAANGV